MNDREFLEKITEQTIETLEKRWYELKGRQMQGYISTEEKNELRRIARRIAKMRQW